MTSRKAIVQVGNILQEVPPGDTVDGALSYLVAQGLTGPQQAQARSNAGAQAALGYTPVQSGGGTGQTASGANAIKIGYATDASGVKMAIDATDLGLVWTDGGAPKLFSGVGYQKLPSGLILQWGSVNAGGNLDPAVTFPTAFPTSCFMVLATVLQYPGAGAAYTVSTSSPTKTSFAVYPRGIANGGAVSQAGVYVMWLALGF